MRVLVLDTALGACSVGLFQDGERLAGCSEAMARGHQERLGGLAQAVLAQAGVAGAGVNGRGAGAIDRIGVTVGPGSFTGLRVGLAFAQGLGLALERPVVGLNTLDALAASVGPASAGPDGLVAAVTDARREQVYVRLFRAGGALGPPAALSVSETLVMIGAARRPGEALALVGSGASLLADGLPDAVASAVAGATLHPLDAPTLDALAWLTARATAEDVAAPLYLRAPDAKLPAPRS